LELLQHRRVIEEVVTNCDHLQKLKFPPQLPAAFTEHGAMMAAMVLNSPEAVAMSVFVVRAFVQMRERLAVEVCSPAFRRFVREAA
jgi:hypothetical protein